ncbi:hypothetical protein AtEden1_Chr1g0057211 [Arabidopsis thaliana]
MLFKIKSTQAVKEWLFPSPICSHCLYISSPLCLAVVVVVSRGLVLTSENELGRVSSHCSQYLVCEVPFWESSWNRSMSRSHMTWEEYVIEGSEYPTVDGSVSALW